MALKPSFHFVCFLTIVSSLCNANRNIPNFPPLPSPSPSPSPFYSNLASTFNDFDYQSYLEHYGYMEYARANVPFGASQDEILKEAILTFQTNFGLSQTGEINDETMLKMLTPRCGVPDIIDGINSMILLSRKRNKTEAEFPSYYEFLSGSPRWPYTRLSYTYVNDFPDRAKPYMEAAFRQWANVSVFSFYENLGFFESDIVIGFFRGDHGDGAPFDGPEGVLAHAFPPDDGRLHFDADEKWSLKNTYVDGVHFESVATHELGHILGLDHSEDSEAVMYPFIATGQVKKMHEDDINGINVLYPPCTLHSLLNENCSTQ